MGSVATKASRVAAAASQTPKPRARRPPPGFEDLQDNPSDALAKDREASRLNPLQDYESADKSVKIRRRAVSPELVTEVNSRDNILVDNMNKLSGAIQVRPQEGVFPTEEQRRARLRELSPEAHVSLKLSGDQGQGQDQDAATYAGVNQQRSRKNLPTERRNMAPLSASEDPLAVGRLTAQQMKQILSPTLSVDQQVEMATRFGVEQDLVRSLRATCTLILKPTPAPSHVLRGSGSGRASAAGPL
jgi:hypothetical protein